jgi:hypothetical protein
MSAYFVGFLFASRLAPVLIRRVGHVRVFSALGSAISAILILYPVLPEPWVWALARVAIGFCYCGVYITAESWLNDAASNENRGKALSLYMIVMMGGIVTSSGSSARRTWRGSRCSSSPRSSCRSASRRCCCPRRRRRPSSRPPSRLRMRRLIAASPLACAGMFLLGTVFAAQFGMSAVYGTAAGLSRGRSR